MAGPAPEPLNQAKRAAIVNTLVDKSEFGEVNYLPQTLDYRLTPMHPVDGGARITAAHGISFYAPFAGASEGIYMLEDNDEVRGAGWVELYVPTEKDELYVVDCRVLETNVNRTEGALKVIAPGISSQRMDGADGHVVFAFKAKKPKSGITLVFVKTRVEKTWLAFWGCDIGKAS